MSQQLNKVWQEFIQAELKRGSKLGKSFEKAGFGEYGNKILTLCFSDENLVKTAKGLTDKLKKELPGQLKPCDRINFTIGTVAAPVETKKISLTPSKFGNPLQALNYAEFGEDRGRELSQPVLAAAVSAEKTCNPIYQKLTARTKMLAGDNTLSVSFNWRLRVGGTRGFRELLLPVFHPVFGIPYIPAASLKGAARAWARQNGESKPEISEILGMLEGKIAKAAKVEFLDAFPTKACLSVDIATPQWHWQNEKAVVYKPEPHPLLSLEQPTFLIGLRATKPEYEKYVAIVKEWLDCALKSGIGSRVSSGYGRALGQPKTSAHINSYEFELWTQGMYGSTPPTGQNRQGVPEFRPTAIRGILRYWFRAMALGLYSVTDAQLLEAELFGALSTQGKFSIGVVFNPSNSQDPYKYTGKINLEAANPQHINLLSKLLILAGHLGGVGRGSRRPLHLLDCRMRGCHWSIEDRDLPLNMDTDRWQQFFQELRSAFESVRPPIGDFSSSPGEPRNRQQDTLDRNAQIWLLPSPGQITPGNVVSWQREGITEQVRGSALSFLYSNENFKGVNQDRIGNKNVGGALEIPSFVWIKSIFPYEANPYQVVTIFGVDHPDRLAFAEGLRSKGAILVFGQMPSSNLSPHSNRPILRRNN
jgi:CRISPR-associated protein Cmr6